MKLFFLSCLVFCSAHVLVAQSSDTNSVMGYYKNAEAFLVNNEFENSLKSNDSAILLLNLSHTRKHRDIIFSQRGKIFFNQSKYDSAVDNLLIAVSFLNGVKTSVLKAENHMLLGISYGKLGDNNQGIEFLDIALGEFISLNDYKNACSVLNKKGLIYFQEDKYDSAMALYLECLIIAKKHDFVHERVSPLINISNIYNRTQDYDKALQTLNQALEFCGENESENRNIIVQNIATIWYKKGDYDKALNLYESEIELAEKNNNLLDIAFLKSNLGIVHYSMGNKQKALKYLLETKNIWEELNDYSNLSHTLNNLAVIYNKMGDTKSAISMLKQSIEVAKMMNSKSSIARGYKNIANINESVGNYKQAYENINIYRKYRDSLFEDSKIKYLTEQQAKFDKLQDESKIIKLENEKVKAESVNKTLKYQSRLNLLIFIIVIIVLLSVIFFYIWKMKKNKIINEERIKQIESERKFETAKYVIEGEEKERKRIAQELHDGIGVLLSTASIHFSNVEDKVDTGVSKIAAKAKDLLNEATTELRTISHNMLPSVLSKFGVYEALADIFESLDEDSGIQTDFSINGNKRKLDENSEIMIYRLVQEIVNNTIKHSKANKVSCSFDIEDENITINYTDDGIGFDENSKELRSSFGLNGINSRVDILGGKIINNSKKGMGTNYHIELPV